MTLGILISIDDAMVLCHAPCRSVLPHTYLQMVGQKLLFHAQRQLPALTALPTQLPDEVFMALYVRPFAQAVMLVSVAGT